MNELEAFTTLLTSRVGNEVEAMYLKKIRPHPSERDRAPSTKKH